MLETLFINATLVDVQTGRFHPHTWIGVEKGLITALGSMSNAPLKAVANIIDVKNHLLTPGLIDPHSHRIYAGNRQDEIDALKKGAAYAEIKQKGGGIWRTIEATTKASPEALYEASSKRIIESMQSGLTTIEVKSGYGQNWEGELKMLTVAKQIKDDFPLNVCITFMGAHTLPQGYSSADAYMEHVCTHMLPQVKALGYVDAVDIFCEDKGIGFNLQQTECYFKAAKALGFKVKAHADQLTTLGGTLLAAKYGALSADHLEHLPTKGPWIQAMKKSGTVATLLPATYDHILHNDATLPPIETLKTNQIPIALGTNCNPGNAPSASIRQTMHLASKYYALTPLEILQGVTLNAAKALGLAHSHGQIKPGYQADFTIWEASELSDIYEKPFDGRLVQRIYRGEETTIPSPPRAAWGRGLG